MKPGARTIPAVSCMTMQCWKRNEMDYRRLFINSLNAFLASGLLNKAACL